MNRTKLVQLLPSLALLSIFFLPSPAVSENLNVVPPLSLLLLGGIHYNEVTSVTGAIWLDRNLGASRVATSSTDSAAYGDLYQWGRLTDGHQERSSSVTPDFTYLSSEDNESTNNFAGAFDSPLKFVMAGFRNHYAGVIEDVGTRGDYWSSTSVLFEAGIPNIYRSDNLYFNSTSASVNTAVRAAGRSIRCIKD